MTWIKDASERLEEIKTSINWNKKIRNNPEVWELFNKVKSFLKECYIPGVEVPNIIVIVNGDFVLHWVTREKVIEVEFPIDEVSGTINFNYLDIKTGNSDSQFFDTFKEIKNELKKLFEDIETLH